MCGIAGLSQPDGPVLLSDLMIMKESLAHRGPDDDGHLILADGHLGLAHRRLSVLDLSSKGAQPMSLDHGGLHVVFNGMISNFRSLRRELETFGHRFESRTDTEVLLHGYRQWGTDLFAKLRGMFAFALWDANIRRLFLVRDPFGIKPLFYQLVKGRFSFASQVRALCALPGHDKRVDCHALTRFLQLRYIPFKQTPWAGISKVPPAVAVEFALDQQGQMTLYRQHKYWVPAAIGITRPAEQIRDAVRELMRNSVDNNLTADVPVGLFLSGGIDSAVIGHFCRELNSDISAYSIGFRNWHGSEHGAAFETSKALGIPSESWVIEPEGDALLADTVETYEDLFAGTSSWPTRILCAKARSRITVALGGDGGDELFGGYAWYRNPDPSKLIDDYINHMSVTDIGAKEAAALMGLPTDDVQHVAEILTPRLNQDVPTVTALQLLDLETFLPDVCLAKVDRAAMMSGLEVRVPFLDPDLADLMLGLDPSCLRLEQGLKPVLMDLLPRDLAQRLAKRPKQGFSAPIHAYVTPDRLKADIGASRALVDGFVDPAVVHGICARGHFMSLWTLAILTSWYDRWVT